MKNVKSKPHKELIINGKYPEFGDFYDENKELIYKSIVDVFDGFKTSRKKVLNLYIWSRIQGLEWDTEFNFTRKDTIVLTRDILPYFENIEDYEMCDKILKLYKELTKSN
jgi:hypothetical protein